MLPWNPIYPGIAALFVGALATGLCRPDLWRNTLVGGLLFLALYTLFVLGLKWMWPGYIEAVWNLDDLILWRPGGLPLADAAGYTLPVICTPEELLENENEQSD
jgi:hypothetical protein